MLSAGIIVTLIVLSILNVLALLWMIFKIVDRQKCQNSESDFCPSYACPSKDDQCGIKPYRMNGGTKVCMTYLSEPKTPTITP